MLPIDQWYLDHKEPNLSCLQAMRSWILAFDNRLTEAWKYRMPMFCLDGKMFCYLWTDKKTGQPYLGLVDGKLLEHPQLQQGDRARMKVLYINPKEDLPIDTLGEVLNLGMDIRAQKLKGHKKP